jgi:hypothetical protein
LYATIPIPDDSGWIQNDVGSYSVHWDDPIKQQEIGHNMISLVIGRVGALLIDVDVRIKSILRGPGCYCSNCFNVSDVLTSGTEAQEVEDIEAKSSDEVLDNESDKESNIQTDIITDESFMMFDDV